jgi:hypothetical protein
VRVSSTGAYGQQNLPGVPPRPGAYILPLQPLTTTTSLCACIFPPAGQPAIPSQREDAAGTVGFAGAILGAHACSWPAKHPNGWPGLTFAALAQWHAPLPSAALRARSTSPPWRPRQAQLGVYHVYPPTRWAQGDNSMLRLYRTTFRPWATTL